MKASLERLLAALQLYCRICPERADEAQQRIIEVERRLANYKDSDETTTTR